MGTWGAETNDKGILGGLRVRGLGLRDVEGLGFRVCSGGGGEGYFVQVHGTWNPKRASQVSRHCGLKSSMR